VFPYFGKVDRFDVKEVFPQPTNDLHFTVRPFVKELKHHHLVLQEMINYAQIYLPLAHSPLRHQHSSAQKLATVDLRHYFFVFVVEGVGGDEGLEANGTDVVNKGYFLVLEMHHQHVVYDVEERQAIRGQLYCHWFAIVTVSNRSEGEFAFAGGVETYV
jgi:hypothetical protein